MMANCRVLSPFQYHVVMTALLLLSWQSTRAREVPMKKAIPPQMDPIPTLPEITHRIYFDIGMKADKMGTVVFGLFGMHAPKAVENFRLLSTCAINRTIEVPIRRVTANEGGEGEDNDGQSEQKTEQKGMCYKGSVFHRIIPNFAIQGGDYEYGDGTGGRALFGDGSFEDETFALKFNRPYMLAMSNRGKRHTNRSQFFVTSVKAQWLDGKYVIFGMVLEGKELISQLIEQIGTYSGHPQYPVVIIDSGEMPLKPEDKEVHY